MPPMHEKNEECLRRGLSDVFLHDFLARVYDTRERRGFALFNSLKGVVEYSSHFGNSKYYTVVQLYACGPFRWGNDRAPYLRLRRKRGRVQAATTSPKESGPRSMLPYFIETIYVTYL